MEVVSHLFHFFWDYSISTYTKFFEKRTTCAYQGVRNVSFSENFAYVLNEWPLCSLLLYRLYQWITFGGGIKWDITLLGKF